MKKKNQSEWQSHDYDQKHRNHQIQRQEQLFPKIKVMNIPFHKHLDLTELIKGKIPSSWPQLLLANGYFTFLAADWKSFSFPFFPDAFLLFWFSWKPWNTLIFSRKNTTPGLVLFFLLLKNKFGEQSLISLKARSYHPNKSFQNVEGGMLQVSSCFASTKLIKLSHVFQIPHCWRQMVKVIILIIISTFTISFSTSFITILCLFSISPI